jgi:hypothetical protein
MNVFLWVLQVLLALHTAMGAMWKFSNSPESVPSLSAIPYPVWLGLSVVELLCSLALLSPLFKRSFGKFVPIASGMIAVEMLAFCGVHFASGNGFDGQVIYWLVVAAFCAFIAYGRSSLKPLTE